MESSVDGSKRYCDDPYGRSCLSNPGLADGGDFAVAEMNVKLLGMNRHHQQPYGTKGSYCGAECGDPHHANRPAHDGRYVMNGVQEWMPRWKANGWKTAGRKPVANQELWQMLDEAVNRHHILALGKRPCWRELNERCDQLPAPPRVNHLVTEGYRLLGLPKHARRSIPQMRPALP